MSERLGLDERTREIHRGSRFSVYRVRSDAGRAVVVKVVRSDRRDERSEEMLRHEYEVLRDLHVDGVARALALEEIGDGPALVVDDAGPTDVCHWLTTRSTSLAWFFRVSIQMAEILANVHDENVLHLDVNPSNIVTDKDGRSVTLVDFGLAARVAGFAAPVDPAALEGTLRYLSPEQTGRTGRLVDHRADLYSLGASLHEILTGSPPFPAGNPLEIVHHHLARAPVAPSVTNPAVPQPVSDIVLKLLAKAPEKRYQSAAAVAADLRHAETQWLASGIVTPFELATLDRARQLPSPEFLSGRERETRLLRAALDRTCSGASELWVLAGGAGVGKSSLARALAVEATGRGVWTGAGTFGPEREHTPYAGLVDAFRSVVRSILGEPDDVREAACWRITGALGANAAVITEVVPELGELVGEQPPVAALGPLETEHRFHLAFQAFAGALGAPDHPLLLFLDDLHWADGASLKLLHSLVTDPDARHRLILGAHRPEHVTSNAPLARILEAFRKSGMPVEILDVSGLDPEGVLELLAELLHVEPERAEPLAHLVHDKTAGNPFFVGELLRSLHRDGMLAYDPARRAWVWDLERIRRVAVTDNVVDLLVVGIRRLPAVTQDLLQMAACLGHRVVLGLLAELRGVSTDRVARNAAPAVQTGLLEPDALAPPERGPCYRFAHERVAQAALLPLSVDDRAALHRRIGRRMLELFAGELEDELFAVVDQLNRGVEPAWDTEDSLQLAELNRRAGARARRTAAHGPALSYLRRGIALLPPDARTTHPDLAYALHRDAAECAFLTGHHALADKLVEGALGSAKTPLERAELFRVRAAAAAARGAYSGAIRWGREGLALVGVELPKATSPRAVQAELEDASRRLAGRPPAELVAAAPMRDRDRLAAMRLLADLLPSAYFIDYQLLVWAVARMVAMSLEHGTAPQSAHAYTSYGALLVTWGEEEIGHGFGELGVELADRSGDPAAECRVLELFAAHLNHWRAPLRTDVPLLRRSIDAGLRSGELQYTGYAYMALAASLLASGDDLPRVLDDVERGLTLGRKTSLSVDILIAYRQVIRCLLGRTNARHDFDDDDFDEASYLEAIRGNETALALYDTLRLQALYLLGAHDRALAASRRAAGRLDSLRGLVVVADHALYTALALAARCDGAPSDRERAKLFDALDDRRRALAGWEARCPANFSHKRLLVDAEISRLHGRPLEAAARYEEAIAAAARERVFHEEALANERAGRLYRDLGLSQSAGRCLRAALDRYTGWGASAKVQALQEEIPEIRRVESLRLPSDTGAWTAFDLVSMLKASATLAAEVDLERLLEKLVQVCVESAGAERGVLVIEEGGEAYVRAAGSDVVSLARTPLRDSGEVPLSVIERVRRDRQVVAIGDASATPPYSADPYVTDRGVKAVLGIPLLRQGELVGTFYCENNLTPHVFPPGRVRVLEVLLSQAASSLQISRLVARLTREVKEREHAERMVRFLADASTAFAETLDYEATLARVVHQVVPDLADACAIILTERDGRFRRVASEHADPAKQEILRELERRYPPDVEGLGEVVRTREPILIPELTDDLVGEHAFDAEHARLIRALGVRSVIVVPLVGSSGVLGVLILNASSPGRYGTQDLDVAGELAGRAASAIENARLYEDARRAIATRDEFLSIASHELYTPVTSLQLAIQGLLSKTVSPSPETLRRVLALAGRQVGRLTQLIGELLNVSRIQSGRLALDFEPVDLAEVARDVVDRLGEELARSGSALSLHADTESVGRWDRTRLDQVVTNLVSNAIKFGCGGPIDVVVDGADDTARLVVSDRGIGIPQDRLSDIFERFARGVPTRQYGGLGLGLYLVQQIVQALGGAVHAEARDGGGATFTVELPRAGPPGEPEGEG